MVVFVIILSLFQEEPATDTKLEQWEAEIVEPNNQLDPLNERVGNNVFIINLAQKIDLAIDKIFSYVISVFEGIIEKVL